MTTRPAAPASIATKGKPFLADRRDDNDIDRSEHIGNIVSIAGEPDRPTEPELAVRGPRRRRDPVHRRPRAAARPDAACERSVRALIITSWPFWPMSRRPITPITGASGASWSSLRTRARASGDGEAKRSISWPLCNTSILSGAIGSRSTAHVRTAEETAIARDVANTGCRLRISRANGIGQHRVQMSKRRAAAQTCGEPAEGKRRPPIEMQEIHSVAVHEAEQISHHQWIPASPSEENRVDTRSLRTVGRSDASPRMRTAAARRALDRGGGNSLQQVSVPPVSCRRSLAKRTRRRVLATRREAGAWRSNLVTAHTQPLTITRSPKISSTARDHSRILVAVVMSGNDRNLSSSSPTADLP